MFGIPQVAGVRYHDSGNGPQPLDDLSCVVEPTHMGVAGGENAMRMRVAWILLDPEKQIWHRLIEAPSQEMLTREASWGGLNRLACPDDKIEQLSAFTTNLFGFQEARV